MNKPIILLGGGGHGAVVAEMLLAAHRQILGVVDPSFNTGDIWRFGLRVLGNDAALADYAPEAIELANGLGFLPGDNKRETLFSRYKYQGFVFASSVHVSAVVGRDVILGEGCQIMANVIVNVGAHLGNNIILNSGCIVEHDVTIGSHTHVAPGAVICGGSKIGEQCFIGANSTIIQSQILPTQSIVKAGSLVCSTQDCR